MRLLIIILLSLLNPGQNKTLHPIHFSVVNMEYNKQKEEFDISIKLFADDFEKIINKNYSTTLNLGKDSQIKDYNKFIDKYIKNHLIIIFDKKNAGKRMSQDKIILKPEENSIWIYYKLKYKKPYKVTVRNTVMTDLYNDQKNLFIFTVGKFQEAKKFEKNDTDLQFVVK